MKLDWRQITVTFFLGLFLGAAVVTRCMPFGWHDHWRNPEKFQQRVLHQFTTKLQLTAEQQAQVLAVLENTRTQMEALRKDTRPRFEAIREASKLEIRKVLNPDQQTKFDKLEAEWGSRWQQKRRP